MIYYKLVTTLHFFTVIYYSSRSALELLKVKILRIVWLRSSLSNSYVKIKKSSVLYIFIYHESVVCFNLRFNRFKLCLKNIKRGIKG